VDLLVLRRLALELDERLRGARIDQVYAVPKHHLTFVVGRRGSPRLWFCADPGQPHLYERLGAHPTPKKPPAFAMAARKLLSGRRIEALESTARDRVVTLRCAGDDAARVVFEIIPRRTTAMIVDADDEVRAVWHPRRGRPGVGQPYEPLTPDDRRTPDQLDTTDWSELQASPDTKALTRGLLQRVAGMSLLVAREIASLHLSGTPLSLAAEREIERAEGEETAARIYSPAPLESLVSLPGARSFFLAPYPLRHVEDPVDAPGLHVTTFQSLHEAAAIYYPLRAALAAADQARGDLESALDIAAARTRRTLDAVSEDSQKIGDAEAHRHLGDLLLAHPDAERRGDIATVPDDYADGVTLEVRIDPSRSLVENAQRYYHRARRADRSRQRTTTRSRRLRKRISDLEHLRAAVHEARELAHFGKLARDANRLGVKTKPERWSAPEAIPRGATDHGDDETAGDIDGPIEPRVAACPEPSAGKVTGAAPPIDSQGRPVAPGIRAFTASDGSEILVGRNADANDRLTHKTAAPHDFWLHAEGPGSHVVIRNPQRNEQPTDSALAEAAALAAHFSFARGATKVNIRWTQVRHLRKPRRGPKGQVIVRQSQTVLAEPVDPGQLFGTDEET